VLFISHGLFEPSMHVTQKQLEMVGSGNFPPFVRIDARYFPGLQNGQGVCSSLLDNLFGQYGLDAMQREIYLEGLVDNPEYIDVYSQFRLALTQNHLGGNIYRRVGVVYNPHQGCERLSEEDEHGRQLCCVGQALEMVFNQKTTRSLVCA